MTDGLTYGSARGRWVLTAVVLGSAMSQLDATVVNIALPRIGTDFNVGVQSLQWVVSGYSLTLSAFLLLGGSLGDRYGRRLLFIIGVIWFAVASLLCALAPDAGFLIAARALQGIGGALLTPGSLAILQASFVAEDRGRAIGAWSGLGGLATAGGPLVAGLLLAVGSWRLIFLINLPVAIAVVLIASRHVPESTDESVTGKLDVPGAVWLIIMLATISSVLIEGPTQGFASGGILTLMAAAIVAIVGFLVTERRTQSPMLPPGMFASRRFTATNIVTFLVYGALGGTLFLVPTTLQIVQRYSPLEAGCSLLPVTFLMLLFAARSGQVAARIGPRLQMSVGPLVVGIGLALMRLLTTHSDYAVGVLPGMTLLGIGLVLTVAPLTATAMAAAPAEHAGLASAVNNDVARAAGLIAVAVVPALASLSGNAYLHPATLAHGFRIATLVCAGAAVVGGFVAAALIGNNENRTLVGEPQTPHAAAGGPR